MEDIISRDPVLGIVYGSQNTGKTVDLAYSFPTALFATAQGALTSTIGLIGRALAETRVNDLNTAIDLLKKLAKGDTPTLVGGKKGASNYPVVVFDDFSAMCQVTFGEIEKSTKDIRQQYGKLKSRLLEFRTAARDSNRHVFLTCWKKEPQDVEDGKRGDFMQGGPLLPSKEAIETFPGLSDIVLRTDYDPSRGEPWPYCYVRDNNVNWRTKDRFGVISDGRYPMNMREILNLAAGGMTVDGKRVVQPSRLDLTKYPIPRLPEYGWQEETVSKLADAILAGGPGSERTIASTVLNQLLSAGYARHVAIWTVRDGIDRALLNRQFIQREKSNPWA